MSNDIYSNEAIARRTLEKLLPDPTSRKVCLNLLADSIIQSHLNGIDAAVWAVTLSKQEDFVRLNVGRIEVCAIWKGIFHIILDNNKLSDQDRNELRSRGAMYRNGPPQYANVPTSVWWDIRASDVSSTSSVFTESYRSLIEAAAETVKWRTGYYIHHSPGVLKYIRTFLQRDIPDPKYNIDDIIKQVETYLETEKGQQSRRATHNRLKWLYKEQKRLYRKS